MGDVVEGKYRIDRFLAAGGMGTLVVATHLPLRQPVVIKFMSPLVMDNGSGIRRFTVEARAAARIHSEHVARVFDVSNLPNGVPFIVMEYLEGVDLSEVLGRRKSVPVAEAVDCVTQACQAVAEAHAAGVVHRDLKPANLFRCERADGKHVIKVLDFGVSKLLPRGDTESGELATTGPNVVMGTPLYASPEQLRGAREVDARTDVWALGVILYELVAGRPPFAGNTFMEICAKVAYTPPPPLRELRPEVPPGLWDVIVRALAKDPELRIQSVVELADAIAPYGPASGRRPVVEHVAVVTPRRLPGVVGVGDGTLPAIERPAPPPTVPDASPPGRVSPPALRLVSVASVVALALVGGLFIGQSRPQRATAQAASVPVEPASYVAPASAVPAVAAAGIAAPMPAAIVPPAAGSDSAATSAAASAAVTAPAPSSRPPTRSAPGHRPRSEFGGML
jgi:serine/threonine-protein kinase